MSKVSQQKVKKTKKMSIRLSNFRAVFVEMVARTGLTLDEMAEIFGTTKQNISFILNKKK